MRHQTRPEMKRFYTVAIFTGLRTSELIGLTWVDIGWIGETLMAMIKHSYRNTTAST